MSERPPPGKVAIVGGGVIGGGWAARFLLHGWQVDIYDPQADAPRRIDAVLSNARAALPALAEVPMPAEGSVTFAPTLAGAVAGADWIQESVPEDLALKRRVLREIEDSAPPTALIASSTSGFKPSELREGARHAERILVAHPFNPVYLLPLVEVVAGTNGGATQKRACRLLTVIGMKPLPVRQEIDAHIADRLMESVWREALWLVNDDVATTAEIDDAIRYGFGLRWAQMGLFETYRLAGGEEGMAHFIAQFGPTLAWPWSKLTDVPEMTDELAAKIGAQSDAQSGRFSIAQLERCRDRNLVGLLRALKDRDWGAGAHLNEHDRRLSTQRSNEWPNEWPTVDSTGPLRMLDLAVLPAWIDYNGHMTEYRYLEVFSDTCDRFLLMIGMDKNYLKTVGSYYTVESHVMHVDEVRVDERLYSTTQVLHADAKRVHLFHRLHATKDDRLLASAEQMYLHVGARDGRVCDAAAGVLSCVTKIAAAHASLSRPAAAGRHVGQER